MQLSLEKSQKKVSLQTLGCRLNFSETGSIAQGFADRGYEIVESDEAADVVFLNTCTVTDGADSSCRNLIRKAKSKNPQAKIVVAGCYAQMESEKIKLMPEVDLILGTQEKYKIFDYLDSHKEVHIEKSNEFWGAATTLADSHTRAFLKIQDGCNYVCSFCIIPFARGRSRTISIEDAKTEAKKLVDSGFKEIVLTGVNIGEYERTSGEKLSDLVNAIANTPSLKRLRLSSVEPNTISRELLLTLKQSGIYQNHFHIPLQSGSPKILESMRRKYTIEYYKEVMSLVQEYFPGAAVGADVIVGYPGETEEDFNETFMYLRESPITHFHVFPFSNRKGTTASKLHDQVPSHIKKERVKTLLKLGEVKLSDYAKDLTGQTFEVLFESFKDGKIQGYLPHFIKVDVNSNEDLNNQVRKVKLKSYQRGIFKADLV